MALIRPTRATLAANQPTFTDAAECVPLVSTIFVGQQGGEYDELIHRVPYHRSVVDCAGFDR